MSFVETYLIVAAGVSISVILPIVRQQYPKPIAPLTRLKVAKPYIFVGIGSLITALLIVVYMGDSLTTAKAALIAGFTADSILQKMVVPMSG